MNLDPVGTTEPPDKLVVGITPFRSSASGAASTLGLCLQPRRHRFADHNRPEDGKARLPVAICA